MLQRWLPFFDWLFWLDMDATILEPSLPPQQAPVVVPAAELCRVLLLYFGIHQPILLSVLLPNALHCGPAWPKWAAVLGSPSAHGLPASEPLDELEGGGILSTGGFHGQRLKVPADGNALPLDGCI